MNQTIKVPLCSAAIGLLAVLSGCGSSDQPSSASESPSITRSTWPQVVATPDGYEGRSAEGITGKVFSLEKSADTVAIQMYTSTDYSDGNTIVGAATSTAGAVQDGDFVQVSGTVGPAFTGTNAFGAELTAPTIRASSVKVITALEAAPPPVATTIVNQTRTQSGVSVTLTKVDRLERGALVHLRLRNRSGSPVSAYDSSSKLIQGGAQQDAAYDFDLDLPSLGSDIQPGVRKVGVVKFKRIRAGAAEFVLDWYSSDYTINADPFRFSFRVK
jgi:hypothetical protein